MRPAAEGSSSGGGYTTRTHRELNAYVGSVSYLDLSVIRNTWRNTGSQAFQMAELVENRLAQLTAENGWSGAGAEAFKTVIRHDLIAHLRSYARRAGGFTPEGEQRVSHAADLDELVEHISGSFSTAGNNNIPWDVDTSWQIRRKEVDQSLFGKLDELVTGEDEDYEKAKSDAPYEIVDGQGRVVQEVPKEVFEPIEASVPSNPSSPVYGRTDTVVANDVDRFDRIMQQLSIGSNPRANVQSAATDVDAALRNYAPTEVEQAETTTSRQTGGPGAGGPGSGGPGSGGPGSGGPTDPGPGRPTTPGHPHPGTPVDPTVPHPGRPHPGLPEGPGLTPVDPQLPTHPEFPVDGGPGGIGNPELPPGVTNPGGPGGAGFPGGAGPGTIDPVAVGPAGTAAAGAAPPMSSVGGIGAVTPGAPPGAVSVGATPGVGGMGVLAAPPPGGRGAPGTSFAVGADGRPVVNGGTVGAMAKPGAGVAGAGGASGPGGTGGAGVGGEAGGGRGAGAGAGGGQPAAGAPLAGNRRRTDGDEESEEELDETWLDEDRSVWGERTSAPPSEIR